MQTARAKHWVTRQHTVGAEPASGETRTARTGDV